MDSSEGAYILSGIGESGTRISNELSKMLQITRKTIADINANAEKELAGRSCEQKAVIAKKRDMAIKLLGDRAFKYISDFVPTYQNKQESARRKLTTAIAGRTNNFGKSNADSRNSAMWEALREDHDIFTVGARCQWTPEFIGAVLSAPPGVCDLNDQEKICFTEAVAKVIDMQGFQADLDEADNILKNLYMAVLVLNKAVKYTVGRLAVDKKTITVGNILFP